MGYEYPKPMTDYQKNKCVEIWDDLMTDMHGQYIGDDVRSFDISENIVECEYCADSGKLLTNACRSDPRGDRSETGYFVKGSEPTDVCDRHLLVDYDPERGVVIGECPPEESVKVGLINVSRSFPIQIYVTDAQYTWQNIGYSILPETSPMLPFYNNVLGEGVYSGISNTDLQYNRSCREHFNYFEWKKKQEEYSDTQTTQ